MDDERDLFLKLHRVRAAAADADASLDDALTAARALARRSAVGLDVGIFSLGNAHEAHGMALPTDIDDRIGSACAVAVANATGARYLAHVPHATDGMGPLATRWAPRALPFDQFYAASVEFMDLVLRHHYDAYELSRPHHLWLVSGHGGNTMTADVLGKLAFDLRVGECSYRPAIMEEDGRCPQHASAAEHAVAAHLGGACFDDERFSRANVEAAEPKALYRLIRDYPAWGGMAGFHLFGGAPFDAVRARYPGVKAAVRSVLERPGMVLHEGRGAALYEDSVHRVGAELLRSHATRAESGLFRDDRDQPTPDIEAVLFVLVSDDGELVMQVRSENAPVLPDHLGFFGGGIEPGESAIEALHREAYEELTITLPEMTLLAVDDVFGPGRNVRRWLFIGRLHTSMDMLRRGLREGRAVELVAPEALARHKVPAHDWRFHAFIQRALRASKT